MAKTILPLIITNVAPTVTDDISKGYFVGQEWQNTTTGLRYNLNVGTIGAAVWNITGLSIGVGAANQVLTSNGSNPVWASALTLTGLSILSAGTGGVDATIRNTLTDVGAYARILMQADVGANISLSQFSSTYSGAAWGITLAGYSVILASSGSGAGLIIGHTSAKPLIFGVGSAEVARFTGDGLGLALGATAMLGSERLRIAGGSPPGTPGATDVLIGAGAIKCGGKITSNTESDTVLTGGFLSGYLGYNYLRQGATLHDFNIDTYNGGAFVNALKILQNGAATFASTLTVASITAGDGTAGSPAMRITSEATGLYRSGPTLLGISIAGVQAAGIFHTTTDGGWLKLNQGTAKLLGIYSDVTDGALGVSASTGLTAGGIIKVHGNTHATKASTIELLYNTTVRLSTNATGIGFFGVTPVSRPSGDISAALVNLGLLTAGTSTLTTSGTIESPKVKLTIEGGVAVLVTADEAIAVGEICAIIQGGTTNRVKRVPTTGNENDMPVGVAYTSAAGAGSTFWMVTTGIVAVKPDTGVTASKGYIITTSSTTAGLGTQAATAPAATTHFKECGHFLENGSGAGVATNALVHFN